MEGEGGGQLADLCADELQRGSAMQLGHPGVGQEAGVLIRALPSVLACPWAGPTPCGPQCLHLSPKGIGTTPKLLRKEGGIDGLGWGGYLLTHLLLPAAAQLFSLSLLFNKRSRESGLFCKVLYTNKTPKHTSQPIHLHWVKAVWVKAIPQPRHVQWEEMDRGGSWNMPHGNPSYPKAQRHSSEP